jgi:hypothetical protein
LRPDPAGWKPDLHNRELLVGRDRGGALCATVSRRIDSRLPLRRSPVGNRTYTVGGNPLVSEILAFGDRLLYSVPLSSHLPLARHRHRGRESGVGIGIDFLAGRQRYRYRNRFPTPMPMPMPTGPAAAPHFCGMGGKRYPLFPPASMDVSVLRTSQTKLREYRARGF